MKTRTRSRDKSGDPGAEQVIEPRSWGAGDVIRTECLHRGYLPMKRLAVMGLACLLSACQSNLADLLPGKPDRGADFPAAVTDLSGCTHQATHSMPSPYLFRLIARADQREFLITATGTSEQTLRSTLATPELHFMANGKTTRVEMRERAIGDPALSREIWSIVERCSQRLALARP